MSVEQFPPYRAPCFIYPKRPAHTCLSLQLREEGKNAIWVRVHALNGHLLGVLGTFGCVRPWDDDM